MVYVIGVAIACVVVMYFSTDMLEKIETIIRYRKVKKFLREIVTTQNDTYITEKQRRRIAMEIANMSIQEYIMFRRGHANRLFYMTLAYDKYEHVIHRFHSEEQLTIQDIKNYEEFWDEWHGKRKKDIEIHKNMGYTMSNSQKIPSS